MAQESNQKQLSAGTILRDGPREYEIIKVLGEGSFGITYLAWLRDSSAPGAAPVQVAVKEFFMHDINGRQNGVVTSSITDGMYDKYMRKFKNEASALNRLHHENIVKVHSCFEANNTVYYAMEFLNGGSLDDYLAEHGPLPQEQVVMLAAQVASALSYLHSSNMLHLDLKPSNLMLRDSNHVALIDFGLAKQFDESGNPESSTTIGGGTPGYAPIEQQNSVELANFYGGKSSVLPVTMDIYAFGATLYKMLVGKMPPMPDEILDNDVLPPQCLYERQVRPELIGVLTKAMKPRKKDRYQSVAEMYSALAPMLRPGEETKIWTPEDLKANAAPAAPAPEPTPAPAVFNTDRDAGTVVAGMKPNTGAPKNPWEKPAQPKANPWEKPSQPKGNPFGAPAGATQIVDAKKQKDIKKPKKTEGGGSKLGIIIGACAVLLIAAGAIAYMLLNGKEKEDVTEETLVEVVTEEQPQDPGQSTQEGENTDEGKTDNGKTDEGKTDNGKTDGGKTDNGKPGDGGPKDKDPDPTLPAGVRPVLNGIAEYDANARTITFSQPYNLRIGDEVIAIPANTKLERVTLHANGHLRSCVINGDRYDGINVPL